VLYGDYVEACYLAAAIPTQLGILVLTLAEYNALIPAIDKDTLMLIDDTPLSPEWIDNRGQMYADMVDFYGNTGVMPGKGMYVLDRVNNAEKIIHNYQVLYRFLGKPV